MALEQSFGRRIPEPSGSGPPPARAKK